MRGFALAVVCAGLGGAAGLLSDRLWIHRRPAAPPPVNARPFVVSRQAEQAASARPAVILGDSIVEAAWLPELCGRPVLNAGVSGAKVADAPKAWFAVRSANPSLVVIAIGANDARRGSPRNAQAFAREYERLVTDVLAVTPRVALVTLEPPAPTGEHGAGDFDLSYAAQLDAVIARIGLRHGLKVIDLAAALPSPLPASLTVDGFHLTAEGYGPWRQALQKTC